VNAEAAINVANALVKEAQVAFKNITRLDEFVDKEQWSMIQMKEEYHVKSAIILQIIYQQ
jgi:hypothetical protein